MVRAAFALAALLAAVAAPARGQSEVLVAPYNELVRMTVERCLAAGQPTNGLALKRVGVGDLVTQHDLNALRTRALSLTDFAFVLAPSEFNLSTSVVTEAFRPGRAYDAAGNLRQPSMMDGVGRNGHFTKVPADCVTSNVALCEDNFVNVPPLWIHFTELHTVLSRMQYTVHAGAWTAGGTPNACESRNGGSTFCDTWEQARDVYGIGTWGESATPIVEGHAPRAYTYGQYKTSGRHYAAYACRSVARLSVPALWTGRTHSTAFYAYAAPLSSTWYYRSDFSANGDPLADRRWSVWDSTAEHVSSSDLSAALGSHGQIPEWCSAPTRPDAVALGYFVEQARGVVRWHNLYTPELEEPEQYDPDEDGLVHTGCECVDCPPKPELDWPSKMPLGVRFRLGVSSGLQTGGLRMLGYVTEYQVHGSPRQMFSLDTRVLVMAGDASDSWGFAMVKRPCGAEVIFSLKGRTAGRTVNLQRPYRASAANGKFAIYFPGPRPVLHVYSAAGDLVETSLQEKNFLLTAAGSPSAWPGLTVERSANRLNRVTSTTGVALPQYSDELITRVTYQDRKGAPLDSQALYPGSRIYRVEDADGRVLQEARAYHGSNTWELWQGVVTNEPVSVGLIARRTRSTDPVSGALTETESRILAPGTAQESSNGTVRVLRRFDWGLEIVEEIAGAGGPDPQHTRYTYGTDRADTNNWSLLTQVERPDGSWTRYAYDALGRERLAVTPFGSAAPTAPESQCRVRRTIYAGDPALAALEFPATDVTHPLDARPRLIVEDALGVEVARTYYAYLPDGLVTKTCPEAGAAYSAPGNLTRVDAVGATGAHAGRPSRAVAPDGTLTTWAYALDTNGPTLTTVTETGAGSSVVTQGLRTITIADDSARVLSERTEDIATGLRLAERLYERDGYGRVVLETNTVRGTSRTREYDCCGVATETDEDGVTTFREYDALQRPSATLRLGIREETTYDALGRAVRVTRSAPGQPDAVTTTTYDPAGRVTETRDAAGNATRYTYRTNSLGEREITRTGPDGHSVTETWYRDGSLKSVTGPAAHPRFYVYGVDADGPYTLEYAGADTNATHWVKSCTDRLGRPARTVYADGHAETNGYDALGRPARRAQGAAAVLTAYDAAGEPFRTALDLNGNGVVDLDGADRVTETRRRWRLWDGGPVEETLTFAYPEFGSAAPRLAAAELRSADGSRAWSVVAGRTNALVTAHDPGAAARVETVTLPDGTRVVTAWTNGLRRSVTRLDAMGAPVGRAAFDYDSLGRLSEERTPAPDGATLCIRHAYDLLDRETNTTRTAGALYESAAQDYDALGRVTHAVRPDGGEVRYEYAPTGERTGEHGARTWPVRYGYDEQGRLAALSTYRAGTNGAADTTRWEFDPRRGWPVAKVFADGTRTQFEYRPDGLLARRTWARGVRADYAYDAAGGLTNVSYSDGTPAVSYTLDRLGRPWIVRDAAGVRTNAYAADGTLAAATQPQAPGLELRYERDAAGRLTAIRLAGADHAVQYGYDDAGRLSVVTNGGMTTRYDFGPEGDEVTHWVISHRAGPSLQVTNAYDGFGRLLRTRAEPAAGAGWSHEYAYDAAGLRTRVSLGDGGRWDYDYDELGQLTGGRRLQADGTPVAGAGFAYGFDTIGNRTNRTVDGAAAWTAQATAVNEYAQIALPGQAAATPPRGAVFVLNGSGLSPFGGAAAAAPQVVVPAYDADGNLLSDGASTYAWDAENRLIAMETGPAGARTRMTCVYDDQGRRTRKTLSAWSTDHWSPVTDHFFLYDGWNLICEYTDTPTPPYSVTNLYVWGLDLSGTLQGAGGIGGLLSLTQVSAFTLHPSFDGSGNVVGLVDAATGEAAARYEYGPFGELLRADGPSAESNPFRFSTKYADRFPAAPDATLYYYGYRHYSPAHARWLSRDPLGEDGGANLYGFVMNCPQTHTDAYGDSARRVVSDFFVGARVAAGDVMSLVSGDAFDSANYVSDIPAGQCSVTITINGIMNSEESAARLEDLARRAQRYSGSYVIRVKNATHYAGDFVQILGHELGIIDVAASRTAHQIQLARQALARNRCCCASIQVMAHSQGTMVFNRALPLLDKETRAMVCFTGFGGQKAVSSSAGLRAVENYGNQNDWVWRANSNPFRWMDYTFYTQDHPLNVTKSPAPGRMEHSFEPHYASLLASLQPNCSCKDTP